MKKKFFALILSFSMLLSLIPANMTLAMATDETSGQTEETEIVETVDEETVDTTAEPVNEKQSEEADVADSINENAAEEAKDEIIEDGGESDSEEAIVEEKPTVPADTIDVAGRKATLKGGSKLYAGINSKWTWNVNSDRTVTIAKQYTVNGAVWYKLSDNGGIDVYKFVRAEDVELISDEPVETVKTAQTSDGKSITVSGKLPENAVVEATAKPVPSALKSDDTSVFAVDIKIVNNGEEIQPTESVRLTIGGVTMYENTFAEVVHILDDADAIRSGIASGKAIAVDDAAVVAAHPAEAALAASVTGNSGVVYVEAYSTYDGNVSLGNGTVTITTSSFSTYYIVSGNSANGNTNKDITLIDDDSDTNYYYVAPGTQLTLERENAGNAWWGADKNNVNGVLFKAGGNNVSTNAKINRVTSLGTSIGENWTKGDKLSVSISSNATIGQTYTITSYRGLTEYSLNNKKTLVFVVMSQADIINNIMSNTQYPVHLTVMRDGSTGIPGEPGIASKTWYYADSGMTSLNTSSNVHYSESGSGVIASDISSNPYFTAAKDGTNTMGVADATGVQTKAVVSGINWDDYLDLIARSGNVKATDGVTITNANKANYEVIPHVVKLQTAYSLGWHIDCHVAPKAAITVSYNPNIPEGYTAANIDIPQSVSKVPPASVTIERLKQGSTTINIDGTADATDGTNTVSLKFKGWNTKSDGSGTTYNPGATGTFTEDTVLYAMWESNITSGTLDISKKVTTAQNSEAAPANDTFTFTVSFQTSGGARPYTIYNAAGQVQSTGTVSSGGTITLKDGQWARITGVPNGAYSVTEASKENYTPSSTGASGTIKGGAVSTAAFTNEYNKPKTANYTINYYKGSVSGELLGSTTKSGIIGSQVPAVASGTAEGQLNWKKPTEGYGDGAVSDTYPTIAADGSTVINVVYPIKTHDATAAIATGDAGVSATSGTNTYDYGASVTFGATLKPGYDFIGWFNNAQGTGTALGTNTSYNFTMPDNAVTYYAKTTEQTVDYTYVAVCKDTVPTGTNFGSVSKNAETVGKVTGTPSATATASTPTFRFVGWFDNADGTGTALSTELTYAPNNKDSNGLLQGGAFYAVFEYNEADYTVKHYQRNVDGNGYTEVTEDKQSLIGTVGQLTEAVAKTATEYPGFHALEFTQQTVKADGTTVVEIYYDRNPHKVTYVVEGDDPSADDEVDYLFGQTIEDYTPTQTNYDFDGWYTDENYTTEWTKPASMPDENITVYGKFVRQTASLKLSKSGMASGESAIFTITGEGLGNGLRVVVPGNDGSVTVSGLLVGAVYTIAEDNGWNWKYQAQSSQTVTPTEKGELYEIGFTNVKETPAPAWLSDETNKKNVFDKAGKKLPD